MFRDVIGWNVDAVGFFGFMQWDSKKPDFLKKRQTRHMGRGAGRFSLACRLISIYNHDSNPAEGTKGKQEPLNLLSLMCLIGLKST